MSAAQAARRAESLIETLKIPKGLPIQVEAIADQLGLRIVEHDLGDDVSGALVSNPQGSVILIQPSGRKHPPTRRRFTIAHEIGHHVLRHHFKQGEHVHVDKGNYISLRGRRASEGVDPKEIEANWFAASLLMPSAMVAEQVAELGVGALHDHHVESLADTFGVSLQAMTIRLSRLGHL